MSTKPVDEKLAVWSAMARPPKSALKTIRGGRLQGLTDVSPQWRYQAMTKQFGPIGIGWKFEVAKFWTEPGVEGEVLVFVMVEVRYRLRAYNDEWSDPVVGTGGNKLISKEREGLRANDEAFKMATTDALSAALKLLGVAADIYAGLWDGSKYLSEQADPPATVTPPKEVKAARKARGPLPEGICYLVKVIPKSKGTVEWAELITSDGEVLVASEPGLITLATNLTQENSPVEISKHRNSKGSWVIDELARYRPEPVVEEPPPVQEPGVF